MTTTPPPPQAFEKAEAESRAKELERLRTQSAEELQGLRTQLESERETVLAELSEHGADPYTEKVDRIAGIDDNFADSGQGARPSAANSSSAEPTRAHALDVLARAKSQNAIPLLGAPSPARFFRPR